ncbi:MAG: tryptophan 7-halogenase [Paucibacter sp.]|nr:tryptophan 7-halogenase [Roseateles sp.]
MTTNTAPKPVRRVVIAGGGTAGWMVAAGLSKCLGRQVDIRLVESEEIGTVGVGEATIPTLHLLHEILDLDEVEFIKATQATFKLGISFENWRDVGQNYFHSFGKTGKGHWTAGFHHFWLEGRKRGLASEYGDYCLELRAGLDHRFARLPENGINYAYHFDATLYGQYLRRYAEGLGVQRIEGKIGKVHTDEQDGFVTGLTLGSGELIEGDLFIDCTGMRSLLLGETLGVPYEDWSHWLPCDSAVAAQTTLVGDALPYTRSIAHPWGWQWRIGLQHRVGNGLVYSSKHLSDEDAKAALAANVKGELIRAPRVIKFTPGQREVVWKKNVVAIGLSSGFLEPLESTSIHLIQKGMTRLVQMFPANGICQSDIDEYNLQARAHIENCRDFVILHYHVQNRNDSDFWRRCRDMEVPELLRHRIEMFRDSARVMLTADELFAENSWVQVMMGQGIVPAGHHPITRQMDDRSLSDFLSEIRRDVARTLIKLPKHGDYIHQSCAADKPMDAPMPPQLASEPLRINPQAQLQTVTLADGTRVYVVDDFALNPEVLVAQAQAAGAQFKAIAGHPYPGPQMNLPPALAEPLEAFFDQHCRERLHAGASLGSLVRLSRVTQEGATLDGRQRICHRDDSLLEAGEVMSASVHYLFEYEALGGTVFFRPRLSDAETQALLNDANRLAPAVFGDKYGIAPGYMTESNRYFECIGRVPAKWNRIVFYDGSIFHSGDIRADAKAYQTGLGRLTVNAFFKSQKLPG